MVPATNQVLAHDMVLARSCTTLPAYPSLAIETWIEVPWILKILHVNYVRFESIYTFVRFGESIYTFVRFGEIMHINLFDSKVSTHFVR